MKNLQNSSVALGIENLLNLEGLKLWEIYNIKDGP